MCLQPMSADRLSPEIVAERSRIGKEVFVIVNLRAEVVDEIDKFCMGA